MYIYSIVRIDTNEVVYVGQRTKPYIGDDKYMGSGYLISNAYKKYGKESFRKERLCIANTQEDLDRLEILYIILYKSMNLAKYNLADGGNGGNYCKYMSEDVLKKINKKKSEAHKKRYSRPEERRRLSEIMKNLYKDPEERRKISEAQKNRCTRPEVRRRLSEAQKNRWQDQEMRDKFINGMKKSNFYKNYKYYESETMGLSDAYDLFLQLNSVENVSKDIFRRKVKAKKLEGWVFLK